MGDGGKGNHKRDDDDIGMFEKLFCSEAAPKQQAGWMEGGVPFSFLLLDFWTRKECEKRFFYTPGHTRASFYIFVLVVVLSAALFYKYGKEGGRLLTCYFISC